MDKREIKKNIKQYLKDNFEGKKFFRINMLDPICLNKFIHADINYYQTKMESGIFDNSKTEFDFKPNYFNKDYINVKIILNNSDCSFSNNINITISKNTDISSIINDNFKSELDKLFNEEINLNNEIEANNNFARRAAKLVNDKIDSIKAYEKENLNNIEKEQARLLLEYYNMLIEDFLNAVYL